MAEHDTTVVQSTSLHDGPAVARNPHGAVAQWGPERPEPGTAGTTRPAWVPDDAPVFDGACVLCDFDSDIARDVGQGGFVLGCGPACSCDGYMGGYLDAEADAAEQAQAEGGAS